MSFQSCVKPVMRRLLLRVHPDVLGTVGEKFKHGNEQTLKSLLDIVATTSGGSAPRAGVSRTIAALPRKIPLSFHLRPDKHEGEDETKSAEATADVEVELVEAKVQLVVPHVVQESVRRASILPRDAMVEWDAAVFNALHDLHVDAGLGKSTKEMAALPYQHREAVRAIKTFEKIKNTKMSDAMFRGESPTQTKAEKAAARKARKEEMDRQFEHDRAQDAYMNHAQTQAILYDGLDDIKPPTDPYSYDTLFMLAFSYVRPPHVDLSTPIDPALNDGLPSLEQQAVDLDKVIAAHDKLVAALAKPAQSDVLHSLMYESQCSEIRIVMGEKLYHYGFDSITGLITLPPNFSEQAAAEHIEMCVFSVMGRK